jgi:hypothetical protein
MFSPRAAIVGIVVAAVVGVTAYRIHVIRSDNFNAQLAALAGPKSQHLGNYIGWSAELEMKMADSLRKRRPFWARSDRTYINVHNNDDRWNVSEGFVLTADGKLFRIDRRPPTFWSNPRLRTYRIDSPRVVTHVADSAYYYIEMYDRHPVENPFETP